MNTPGGRLRTMTQFFGLQESNRSDDESGSEDAQSDILPDGRTNINGGGEDDVDDRDFDLSEEALFAFTQRYTQDDNDNSDGEDSDDAPSHNHSLDLSQQELEGDDYIDLQKKSWVEGTGDGTKDSPLDLNLPHGRSVSRIVTNEHVSPPAKKQKRFKDTVDTAYYLGREFKRDEAYFSKHDPEKINILVIKEFTMIRGQEHAVCDKYQRIESTFVGHEVQGALTGKYVLYEKRCNKWLPNLGERTDMPSIEKSIYYKVEGLGEMKTSIGKKKNKSCARHHGFEISYTVKKKKCLEKKKKICRPTVLEVFAGAGGMSQGFRNVGFDQKWAVEEDQMAAATYLINHGNDVQVHTECARVFLKKAKENPQSPHYKDIKPNHIHTSTPCQAFSQANRNGGKNDKRNSELTPFCAEYVEHYRPETYSFENVTGILDLKNVNYLQKLVAALIEMDYSVRVLILDSKRYGDPQSRKRVFLMAALPHLKLPKFPVETHGNGVGMKPFQQVCEAIGNLRSINVVDGDGRISYGPEESNVTFNHNEKGTGLKTEVEVLKFDKPANTLTRKGNIRHYNLKRCLSVREMARLFSFDDSFRFFGNITQQRSQVGNAVPVKLATAVAKEILETCYK